MVYGYVIIKYHTITYGLSIWHSAEWSHYYTVSKVRVFRNKKERDNAMKIEKKNHGYEEGTDMLPFETKSKQGKLNMHTRQTISDLRKELDF